MFPIIDVETARKTILKRQPIDEVPVSAGIQKRLSATFGEVITPAQAVSRILLDVRRGGDQSLRFWTDKLDGVSIKEFKVSDEAKRLAMQSIDPELYSALKLAANRIELFYRKQPMISWMDQSMGGTLGQVLRPIGRVGIYVPGGTAPLPSTVLMSAIPAKVAGVKSIALVTPPGKDDGVVNPVILAAAAIAGVDEVYTLGGAQAIAALAFGSESIPAVEKIVGPGNLFVTLAKQQVYGIVGIDGLAGPTETIVIADDSANPSWAAADLLAQAEHDVLASAILLTPSRDFAQKVQAEISAWLEGKANTRLTRTDILAQSLQIRSGAVIVRDLDEAIMLSNSYAPEHLNLSVAEPWNWLNKVTCAGGVFVGERSCEVMGDYVAGPSHVMPTGGSARFASPLNVWDFLKVISVVALDQPTSAELGGYADLLARAEGLDAHALAGRLRAGGVS
jgi:histidinol dehydrogenase